MGGTAKKIANVGGRVIGDVATGGLAEFGKKDPWTGLITNKSTGLAGIYNPTGGSSTPGVPGPFTLDQAQFQGDRNAINTEGQRQYDATVAGLGDVSKANTQRAKDLFGSMLPDIAENSQAAHLYDSTGYGQEVARQQAQIASQVANSEAQQKQAALGGLQGFQTGALQRGLGLEDFINQANVAKTIGAQTTPQAPSSKATGFTRGVAGAGAGAPFGPAGAALGGAAGLLSGGK